MVSEFSEEMIVYPNPPWMLDKEVADQAAYELEKFSGNVANGMKEQVIDISGSFSDGFLRGVNKYGSLAWPGSKYDYIYEEYAEQDHRFWICLGNLLDLSVILQEILKQLFTFSTEHELLEIENRIAEAVNANQANWSRTLAKGGVYLASKYATKEALVSAVALNISILMFRNSIGKKIVEKYGKSSIKGVLTVVMFYSYIEKASRAVDDLKFYNMELYQTLYSKDLEMLYFLIDPYIPKDLLFDLKIRRRPEEIIQIIQGIII